MAFWKLMYRLGRVTAAQVWEQVDSGNLTELQAVNIINGFHIPDYVRIAEVRAAKEAQEHEN